jgi:hypothetical protein
MDPSPGLRFRIPQPLQKMFTSERTIAQQRFPPLLTLTRAAHKKHQTASQESPYISMTTAVTQTFPQSGQVFREWKAVAHVREMSVWRAGSESNPARTDKRSKRSQYQLPASVIPDGLHFVQRSHNKHSGMLKINDEGNEQHFGVTALRRTVRRLAVAAQDPNRGGHTGRAGWSCRALFTGGPGRSRITFLALRSLSAAHQADG